MSVRSPWSPRIGGFLLAEALSAVGSWSTIIAVWGFAAYRYGASPAEVSLFGIAFAVPGIVLGPLTGAIVDRFGPRLTLGVAKSLGAAASLGLLAADDFRTLSLLSALHGVAMALTYPALAAIPPRLVDDQFLARTNALVSLTDEVAIALGPVVAGVSIAVAGFEGAFVLDAATYALGLVVLPLVRLADVPSTGTGEPGEAEPAVRLRDALEGWKLIGRVGVLRRTVACTFAMHLLYGCAVLAEPLYVRDTLQRSEQVFAALQTVFGVFLVGGGLIATRLGERLASFRWVALGVAASGVAAIVYLGTPWVVVAFLGVGLWGVASALISGPSRTVLQRSSPVSAHGRVMAADMVAAFGSELLGVIGSGVLITAIGVPWSMTVLGISIVIVAAFLFVADRRDPARVGEHAELVA